MKTVAPARRSAAKSGPFRSAVARVQTKARPGSAGNHRRQGRDSLERQAEEIARRIMRGENNLARRITPTAAAGFRASGSQSMALPHAVRQQMETAFGANFQVVRIHTGGAADAAARDHNANALASGRDIYFRAGYYAPHTADGKELLAHELVHVLQQTGRRDSKGQLAAVPALGSAQPQCDDTDLHRDDLVAFLATDADALGILIKRHRAAADTDESLKKLTEVATRSSGGKLDRNSATTCAFLITVANNAKFTDDQTGTEYAISAPARGFLIDCLKVCGTTAHYDAAALLLEADAKCEALTAFAARTGFRDYLTANYDEQWFSEAFAHPLFKKVWPSVFLNVFSQFFLNPGRGIQALYYFDDLKKNEFSNLDGAAETLLPNDRVILALEQIGRYNDTRLGWLDQLSKAAEKDIPEAPPVNKRYGLAMMMRDFIDGKLAEKQPAFWQGMLSSMRHVTDDAVKLWGDVLASDAKFTAEFEDANMLTSLLTFDRPVSGEFDSLKPLRSTLEVIAQPAKAPAKGQPAKEAGVLYMEQRDNKPLIPSPVDYAKRITALDQVLGLKSNLNGNLLLTLQNKLVELSRQKNLQTDEGRAVGWVIFSLQSFSSILHSYDASKDDGKYPDLRLAHRRRVANYLINLSQALSWAELHSTASMAFRGEDFPNSYLIVPTPWVRLDETPIGKMIDDLEADVPFTSVPLTPREIVFFFEGAFLRDTQKLVQAEVDRVNGDPNAKLEAKKLNEAILALPRPWRCEPPPEMIRMVRVTDISTTDAFTLIGENERSVADLKRIGQESHLGTDFAWAARKRSDGGSAAQALEIFAWIMPSLKPLIQEMQKTEPFKTRMAAVPAADEYAWLRALLEQSTGTGKTAREELDQALIDYAKEGQKGAHQAMRQFTCLNRRLAAKHWDREVAKYADDPTVVNFAIPYRFADGVVNLAVAVAPSIDEKQQTSLFLLSIGPTLEKAFGSVDHAGRLQPYLLTFFQDAVKFADEATAGVGSTAKPEAKAYYEQYLYRNPSDSTQDESLATLIANAPSLKKVAAAMEEAAKNLRQMFGFLCRDGTNLQSVLIGPSMDMTPLHILNPFRDTPLINDPKVQPGERYAMEIDGDDWELVKVHRKFFYHPGLSTMPVGSEAAKPVLVDQDEKPIEAGALLMTFLINGEEKRVMSGEGDDAVMKKLSDAVFTATLVQKLDQMGAEIEEDMNFLMDIVELIPGVGQEFAVARAEAMTVGAILTGQYDQIIEMVKKDPMGYIKKIGGDLIKKYITFEGVLTFVVLGQGGFDFSKWRKPSTPGSTPPTTNPPRGKMARLIAVLRRLGARVANAISWVQLRTAPRLRSVQSTILTRPRVGWLLHRGIDIGSWIASLIPPDSGADTASEEERKLAVLRDLAGSDPQVAAATAPATTAKPTAATAAADERSTLQTMLGPVGEGMQAAAEDFKKQFVTLLDTLAEMELPKEVFPLDLILDIITRFVLTRLGAKVKFAYGALEAAGIVHKINVELGKKLAGIPGDPNLLWQEHVLSKIDGCFHELRNDTVQGIYGLGNTLASETGLDFFKLGEPPLKSATDFQIARSDFPASELARRPGREVRPWRGAKALPGGTGHPLPSELRAKAEAHFGHDFSHVRVHADAGAKTMLDAMGANGLTSGSHVYMATDEEQGGDQLLRHELTHVLQQAGSRPLGFEHSPQPLPGRPGLGVRFYPERESEADYHARRQGAADKPVAVRQAAGVQPSIDPTLLDKVVTSFTELENEKIFEKTVTGEVPGGDKANKVWVGFLQKLEKNDGVKYEPCFASVATEIVAYLKHCGIDQDIQKVASLAQRPVSSGKQKNKSPTELDFDRFVTLFEGALYGKAGVVAQITASSSAAVQVTGVKVTYLHFGVIAPANTPAKKLWEKVVGNTTGLPVASTPGDKTKLYQEIHEWLHALGPDPFAWDLSGSTFRFSGSFVEAFNKTRKTQIAGKVPKKIDYLNDAGPTGIGLRIGIHGGQKGEQRESHHTTQYLLVQFFRNDNTIKAWPGGRRYPGIKPGSGERAEFAVDGGSPKLGLAELDKDASKRGAQMPAILLAADTHRRGQLHVERESRWNGKDDDPDSDPGQGRATQGFAIKAQFQRHLLAQFKVTDENQDAWNKAVAAKGDTAASQGIYDAMLGTYKWMNGLMRPSLEHALRTRELGYYRAMAARDGHVTASGAMDANYDLTTDDMKTVNDKAVTNNKTVMEGAGWTL